MVLVLLNFLLAIICEAFNQAKMAATDNTSVAEEIRVLVMEYWHRLTDRNYVSDTAVLRQLKVWSGRSADSDLEDDEAEDGGQTLRSVNSQARSRFRGREKALKISDDTYVTQEELEDIVGMCIRESATESALLEVNMTESAKRRLADAEAEENAAPLANALFERCAEEIKNSGKKEEEEDVVDDAELATNEHFRAVNEALAKLMAVHQQLLQGHLIVTENQRKVDHASRSVARINADLRKLFAKRGRRRNSVTDGGRRYSTTSVQGSVAGGGRPSVSQARSRLSAAAASAGAPVKAPSAVASSARDGSRRGAAEAGSVRRPPPVATSSVGGGSTSARGAASAEAGAPSPGVVSPTDVVVTPSMI